MFTNPSNSHSNDDGLFAEMLELSLLFFLLTRRAANDERFFHTFTNINGYSQITAKPASNKYRCAFFQRQHTPQEEPVRPQFLISEPDQDPYISDSEQLLDTLRKRYGQQFEEISTPVLHDAQGYYLLPFFPTRRFATPRDLLNAWYGC